MAGKHRRVFAVCLLSLGVLGARGQDTAAPFVLKISTETPIIKSGRYLTVKVTRTNTSTLTEDCSAQVFGGFDFAYNYDVWDDSGKALKKSDVSRDAGSFKDCDLPPNHTESFFVPIDELCDLTAPGKYTIRVSRSLLEGGVVRSNKLVVTVTQ